MIPKKPRVSWDNYFMNIADAVSTRATCDRRAVGCVLVAPETKSILATGFNGSVRGEPHCDDEGHDLVESIQNDGKLAPNCVRVLHAEMNAIAQAARLGVKVDGATAYINTFPCWPSFRLLANAGIKSIVYSGNYRNDARVEDAARRTGITIKQIENNSP